MTKFALTRRAAATIGLALAAGGPTFAQKSTVKPVAPATTGATGLAANIDPSVSPCTDFYEYASGT